MTLVIETGQLLGSLAAGWAWRAFDVDDLLTNTVGALAAGLVGVAVVATATSPPYVPPVDACERQPGLVAAVEEEGGGGLEVGVAPQGATQALDERGNPVRTYAVDGSELRVGSAPVPVPTAPGQDASRPTPAEMDA